MPPVNGEEGRPRFAVFPALPTYLSTPLTLQGESTDTRKPWRFLPKLGGGKADALAAARTDAEAARGAAHGAAVRAAASDAAAADAAGRLAMLQVKHELLIDMVSEGRGEGGEERWAKGTTRRKHKPISPHPLLSPSGRCVSWTTSAWAAGRSIDVNETHRAFFYISFFC